MSLPTTINKDLSPEIQSRIDRAATIIRDHDRATKKAIFEIGKILVDVKNALDHGQFGKWISREFGWTNRTAQNYMNMSRNLSDHSETVSHLPMKIVYDIAALPDAGRADVIAMIADPKNPPVKQIAQKIVTLKNVEYDAKAAAAKEAQRSPAARKAAKARKEKLEAENMKWRQEQEQKKADLAKDSAVLALKMGPELIEALVSLSNTHDAFSVVAALKSALTECPAVDNVVTITGEVLDDDELTDLDYTSAA